MTEQVTSDEKTESHSTVQPGLKSACKAEPRGNLEGCRLTWMEGNKKCTSV